MYKLVLILFASIALSAQAQQSPENPTPMTSAADNSIISPKSTSPTYEPPKQTTTLTKADWVHVKKSQRRMFLMFGDDVITEYRIALGSSPRGHKVEQGDQKTPEGHYRLSFIMEDSAFHRSMHITYPNYKDQAHADRLGIDPGGDIKIHGIKNDDDRDPQFIQSFDWTNGCIAISNEEMDEFLALVEVGTPIFIEW
ncbi:L,D-transpeptidase family protein [Vibrio astriarenae]